MTKDKFNRIGELCCEFQRTIWLEISQEVSNTEDFIRSTEKCRMLSKSFTDVSTELRCFLSQAFGCIDKEAKEV